MKKGLLGLILIIGLTRLAHCGVVVLKEKVVVDGGNITLGKIGEFRGIDPSKVERIKDLVIGTSPLPGRERLISLDYVKTRLMAICNDIRVEGPDKILVRASFMRLDPERVVQVAREYLVSRLKGFFDGEFKLEVIKPPMPHVLPPGEMVLEVIPREKSRIFGPVYIDVKVLIDGVEKGRVKVGFDVHRFQNVIVAKRTIAPGRIINKEDLCEEIRDVTHLIPPSPFRSIESVSGKVAKKTIKEGTIITQEMIETPPVIRRGSLVTIQSQFGNVCVMATGKALRDGREGERIMVRNLSSKQSIEAIVVKEGIVVVKEGM